MTQATGILALLSLSLLSGCCSPGVQGDRVGNITGRIYFVGEHAKRWQCTWQTDPVCPHASVTINRNERFILNKDSMTLGNVIVFVKNAQSNAVQRCCERQKRQAGHGGSFLGSGPERADEGLNRHDAATRSRGAGPEKGGDGAHYRPTGVRA